MRPSCGRLERLTRLHLRALVEELGGDQRAHELGAAAPGDALDRAHRLAVHDQVGVDPRLGPEEQAGEIGDRGDRRAVHLLRAAQAREHDRHRGICGDDDVGLVLGYAPGQRARAEQAQQLARQHSHRGDGLQQPVDHRVGPREEAQLHAIAVLDDRLQQRAHRRKPVDHRHLGGLGSALDLSGERACGCGVALADVGREDQHALGPGAPARCRCAVAAWHTVQALPARWTERPRSQAW